MISNETKPILYLILNFIVGALVAKGYVDGAAKDQLINELANTLGLVMIAASSVVTLYRVIKHPHNQTTQLTVTNSTTPNQTTQTVAVTQPEISQPASQMTPVSTMSGLPSAQNIPDQVENPVN